jgi:hypothetical protein
VDGLKVDTTSAPASAWTGRAARPWGIRTAAGTARAAHFPKPVRDQLKILGIQQDKTMQDLIAEVFNDLFAKYGKPEIAPVSHKG